MLSVIMIDWSEATSDYNTQGHSHSEQVLKFVPKMATLGLNTSYFVSAHCLIALSVTT